MSLVPRWYNKIRRQRPGGWSLSDFFDDMDKAFGLDVVASHPTGLSVWADEKNVHVEADLPGLRASDIDVSLDDEGVLWIKGEKKEEKEDKERKYYKKAHHAFSYCLPLGEEIDRKIEPKASFKDGVMHITFTRRKEKVSEAKKIPIREE